MNLKEARFKKSFTQYDVWLKTGIPQSRISLFERGYALPNDEEKMKLAKALDVKINVLEFSTRE